ncbi:hypothetical protein GALMADRAFT_413891 [Galerina marginata CBS 339.88]|uniref:Uncharacterized protein n=1 Tax=Galerina marginata (strain CBS 339.88) TaxID=685588 RepID=A0A067TD43_GALM3|nr:hypothetical protein GALMADRAFT_413891 [Galerina marginata CBS 339.88]
MRVLISLVLCAYVQLKSPLQLGFLFSVSFCLIFAMPHKQFTTLYSIFTGTPLSLKLRP